MTTGAQRRDAGIQQVSDHNAIWKAFAIQEIKWLRTARTHKSSPKFGEKFLFEQLVHYLEGIYGQIPHVNLAGAIAKQAVSLGYLKESGVWRHTTDDQKNARRSPEYEWVAKTV